MELTITFDDKRALMDLLDRAGVKYYEHERYLRLKDEDGADILDFDFDEDGLISGIELHV